jgi:putative transcriptional regulator
VIDYSPLWKTMQRKNISTYQLINQFHFSKGTLDSLKHNRNVTLHTIETLCLILDAPIQDIVRILPDNPL